MLAVEILSRLTLDDEPIMLRFFADLQRLLFDPQDSPLRIEAGKALIALVASTMGTCFQTCSSWSES
jgi:hypothetical protein